MKKIFFTLLFTGWLTTIGLHAQYDINKLTLLYERSLELRAYTDRLMLDWILREQAVNPVETQKKWISDRKHFQALLDSLVNGVPRQSEELEKQAEKLHKKSKTWVDMLPNTKSSQLTQVKQMAKWYKITVDAEEQFIRTLQKYLGMDEHTLSILTMLFGFIPTHKGLMVPICYRKYPYRPILVSQGLLPRGNGFRIILESAL